jgi:uncharacterized protein (DUF1684 family)
MLLPFVLLQPRRISAQQTAQPDYAAERAGRAREISRPYGWMSLVALKQLQPGITTVGAAKDNALVLDHAPAHLLQLEQKEGKTFLQAADPSLQLHGSSVAIGTLIPAEEQDDAALATGTLRLWVIKRGDKLYLRVKDSEAPALKQRHNLRWYAPTARYRVNARWVPDTPPHRLQVVNKLGQISESQVPGHVEFELDGKRLTLVPLEASKNSLWFVFRDQTSRTDTDQGGRFLTVRAPATGLGQTGTVDLDFNEAVNPPCAYSPYATCPLASKENRISIAIPAGEKRYEP